MSTETTHLKLVKPEMSDYADIRVLNGNMDILDKAYNDLNGKYLPTAGGTMTGDILSSNTTGLKLCGADTWSNGAGLELHAKTDTSDYKGCTIIDANLDDNQSRYVFKPTGVFNINKSQCSIDNATGSQLYFNGKAVGLSDSEKTFELNNGKLYFNGGNIAQIFNRDYSDIKKIDVKAKLSLSELVQGEYSLQIFQDKQTLWTEMYVLVWNSSGDKWFKFKSPVTWKSQEGTFIVTSVGRMNTYDNYADNTCTWIDNNTFYMYSRGELYQMYHFAGFASKEFGTNSVMEYNDETHEMTVKNNAAIELQSINTQLTELNASAALCSDEGDYTVYKADEVVTMNDDQLNEYHTELTTRRSELLELLK